MNRSSLPLLRRLCLASIAVALLVPSTVAVAQTAAPQGDSGQALEISPPVLNLSADPGQTVEAQVSLRDISNGPLVVTGEVNDFTAAGEDGTPKLLLEEGEPSPYSMKSWFAPLPQLELQSRQIEALPITISVPADAAPGGYYAVIRFTGTAPQLEDSGVSLSASIGALVLMRVNGEAKEGLAVEEFNVSQNNLTGSVFQATPLKFTQRIKNTGNIHQQPAGQVVITDMFGKKVAAVNVNLPPRNVLPGTIRKFEQNLDEGVLGNRQLFGRYTAELRLTYGANKQVVTASTSFWVIPYTLIAIIVVGLIVAFFLLRGMVRRHNERIIRRATGQRSSRGRRRR